METHGARPQARLRNGLDLLLSRPDDPELLHSVGVGLAHRGIAALDYERLAVSLRLGKYPKGRLFFFSSKACFSCQKENIFRDREPIV